MIIDDGRCAVDTPVTTGPADRLSPRRPFCDVLQALWDADAEGRLDEAIGQLVDTHRPVLRRAAHQLVHARGLDGSGWLDHSHGVVEQVVRDELPGIVRQRIPVAGLLIILRPSIERAWRRQCILLWGRSA